MILKNGVEVLGSLQSHRALNSKEWQQTIDTPEMIGPNDQPMVSDDDVDGSDDDDDKKSHLMTIKKHI